MMDRKTFFMNERKEIGYEHENVTPKYWNYLREIAG